MTHVIKIHRMCNNPDDGGTATPSKRSRYSNRAVGNSNKRDTENNVKQVVNDEFMKQMRAVRHSSNTTGTANYRVQLAVPPSIIIIIMLHALKKANKQVHTGIFNWSRDHSRSEKMYWNSAQYSNTVNQLKLFCPYCAFHTKR